ncbi:MAG TPA: hypothetical protein VKS20_15700 [Candidatus Acidoferrales bacterium]|nr:hypothetical protein [Candidatus Acidoferrales bacterium]
MSEIFDLMHQARELAQTAKDAMAAHSPAADKTTESIARAILSEAKRLLSSNPIIESISFPQGDVSWVSVRSAMQAVCQALSSENSAHIQAANARRTRPRGPWS